MNFAEPEPKLERYFKRFDAVVRSGALNCAAQRLGDTARKNTKKTNFTCAKMFKTMQLENEYILISNI